MPRDVHYRVLQGGAGGARGGIIQGSPNTPGFRV